MPIELSHTLQARIIAEMEQAFPNEGGGFLLGTVHGDTTQIRDVIHVPNTFESEEQYHRYAMTPQNWAQMEDAADARGLTLVGYYHSHPNSPASPSEYDRVHALPNFVYIITAVYNGKADHMRVWRLRDSRESFDEAAFMISE
jgi:proteasome lid subunit RPN8/RPN11